jgi:hypothetical protein
MSDKPLESYKWDKQNEILNAYKLFLIEGITIFISPDKNIPIASEDLNLYERIKDTYILGDYILDRNDVVWDLTFEEVSELVNAITYETKNAWLIRNQLLEDINNATTVDEVLNIVWPSTTVIIPGIPTLPRSFDFYDNGVPTLPNVNNEMIDNVGDIAVITRKYLYDYVSKQTIGKKVVEFKPPHRKLDADKLYEFAIDVTGANIGDSVTINLNVNLYNKLDSDCGDFTSWGTVIESGIVSIRFRLSKDIGITTKDKLIVTVI